MKNAALWLFFAVLLLGGGAAAAVASSRVRNRQNAKGVRPELQALLDAWEREGAFDIEIPSTPWGGLRTSAADQASYADDGYSNASTLQQTPHGRGAALDAWPVGFSAYVNGRWENVPASIKQQFAEWGAFAEARGFTWGGRWRTASLPNGDQPHVELANWQSLPFPPPAGGYS